MVAQHGAADGATARGDRGSWLRYLERLSQKRNSVEKNMNKGMVITERSVPQVIIEAMA